MKLNLGCGSALARGWCNVDIDHPTEVHDVHADFMRADLREPLPFGDDSVDMIACHHVLDLLARGEVDKLIAECHRVLHPGGTLRISLFDGRLSLARVVANDQDWFRVTKQVPDGGVANMHAWLCTLGGKRKWLGEPDVLVEQLEYHGFKAHHMDYGVSAALWGGELVALDTRQDESFFVEGRK